MGKMDSDCQTKIAKVNNMSHTNIPRNVLLDAKACIDESLKTNVSPASQDSKSNSNLGSVMGGVTSGKSATQTHSR